MDEILTEPREPGWVLMPWVHKNAVMFWDGEKWGVEPLGVAENSRSDSDERKLTKNGLEGAAAGWYQDPAAQKGPFSTDKRGLSKYQARYWDGAAWTNYVGTFALPAPARPSLHGIILSTLNDVAGYRVTEHVGAITSLKAASGFTAGVKGNEALDKALAEFADEARAKGANAILGLQVSAFGAGGGITSVLGGDAVGVILAGTAVVLVDTADTPDLAATD